MSHGRPGARPCPVISPALVELAEDPEFFIEPADGSRRTADERFCLTIGPYGRHAGVCRLRLASDPDEVAETFAEIRELAAGVESVLWNVGSSATPTGLAGLLRALGLRDPDPPFEAVVAALVLEQEPPRVEGVEVRRIETFEQHLAGLEILIASATWAERAAAAERERAEEVFEHRMRRGGLQWLAWLGGKPVAYGAAERASAGLYLGGGATLPAARGGGCYRALVRARWDEAVRLGIPALAVQAQYGSSAPILRKLGFVEVAVIHTLQQ